MSGKLNLVAYIHKISTQAGSRFMQRLSIMQELNLSAELQEKAGHVQEILN